MAEYLVKLADDQGHMMEQVESARSEAEVRERFVQQGYLVFSIKSRGLLGAGRQRRKGIKLQRFVIFNQQFVTLIRAGLPILQGLGMLAKQQKDPYFRGFLENVRDRVKGGSLLSDAFEAQGAFPKIYSTTLMAGEKSGNLEEVLHRYVSFQRLALAFRKRMLASLIYPTLLIVLVIVMLTFLVTFVVPKFAELYSQLNVELPAITQFMMAMGVGAQKYLLAGLGVLALLAIGAVYLSRKPRVARWLDQLRMHVPLMGSILLKYQVAVFSRMMSTLLAGGLPLVPAMETAGTSMQSPFLSEAIVKAARSVREGRPLSASLKETKLFPDLTVEMVEVGESTGALPQMLSSVAEFYEEDVETALTSAMALVEPALLIIMGVVVATILISLYLPIFNLSSAMGGGAR
jgi:type IV pilus assembly protein PilC